MRKVTPVQRTGCFGITRYNFCCNLQRSSRYRVMFLGRRRLIYSVRKPILAVILNIKTCSNMSEVCVKISKNTRSSCTLNFPAAAFIHNNALFQILRCKLQEILPPLKNCTAFCCCVKLTFLLDILIGC